MKCNWQEVGFALRTLKTLEPWPRGGNTNWGDQEGLVAETGRILWGISRVAANDLYLSLEALTGASVGLDSQRWGQFVGSKLWVLRRLLPLIIWNGRSWGWGGSFWVKSRSWHLTAIRDLNMCYHSHLNSLPGSQSPRGLPLPPTWCCRYIQVSPLVRVTQYIFDFTRSKIPQERSALLHVTTVYLHI